MLKYCMIFDFYYIAVPTVFQLLHSILQKKVYDKSHLKTYGTNTATNNTAGTNSKRHGSGYSDK